MNTLEIELVMKRDNLSKKSWLGVFPKDRLPYIFSYPAALIFNTDNSDEPGSHWIAIYFGRNRKAEFFDSFGNSPSFYDLNQYLEQNSTSFVYNNTQIQGYNSNYCGLYALLYIYLRNRGNNLQKIINFFKSRPNNDKQIAEFLINN